MGFIDEADITVKSGNGGAGCVSFKRERFIPKGGPDGGDGGKGGDVLIKATQKLYSLYDFGSRRYFKAENGRYGSGKNRAGRNGRDIEIFVPVGTMIKDGETGELLADLIYDSQQIAVLDGGNGGKGNKHFATSTNRAPRFAQEGVKGKEKRLKLELKLIAHIGIIGLPNVGKSTLLSCLSNAKPQIGNFAFTTLSPNLGVMDFDDDQSLIIADIPGLIEGASKGKGLGHRFLQHIERTSLLLHMLDIQGTDGGEIMKQFFTVQKELESFPTSLASKEQIIVLNKIDLIPFNTKKVGEICNSFEDKGYKCVKTSALTGKGIDKLKQLLKEIGSSLVKIPDSLNADN